MNVIKLNTSQSHMLVLLKCFHNVCRRENKNWATKTPLQRTDTDGCLLLPSAPSNSPHVTPIALCMLTNAESPGWIEPAKNQVATVSSSPSAPLDPLLSLRIFPRQCLMTRAVAAGDCLCARFGPRRSAFPSQLREVKRQPRGSPNGKHRPECPCVCVCAYMHVWLPALPKGPTGGLIQLTQGPSVMRTMLVGVRPR